MASCEQELYSKKRKTGLLQTRRAYVMVSFPMSALKQLQPSEHEERLAHLQAQKSSGVLLDQNDCLFVYCVLEHLVLNL